MASGYLTDMLVVRADGFVDPCIPTLAAKAAVLVVPGIGADAEDPWFAYLATGGKGNGVEPVIEQIQRRAAFWFGDTFDHT